MPGIGTKPTCLPQDSQRKAVRFPSPPFPLNAGGRSWFNAILRDNAKISLAVLSVEWTRIPFEQLGDGTVSPRLWLSVANGWDMHNSQFCAHIRAHAHALVRMARVQPDLELALELEALAINLLKLTHEFEIRTSRL
jgi:hypothetical protein